MRRKTVSGMMLTLLLVGMLTLAFDIQPVKSDWTWTETIYIRADGSIYPDTAPISTVDNITYALTDNIVGDVPSYSSAIVVERDNIVVDGAGHTLQGIRAVFSEGISLSERSNITIKNMETKAFYRGIYLIRSSNNTISGNNLTNNDYGIYLYGSSSNTLRNNDARNNKYNFGVYGWLLSHYIQDIDDSNTVNGKPVYYWVNRRDMAVPLGLGWIALVNCTNITVKNLNLANNGQGLLLAFTTNSTITKNNITNNDDGIYLYSSSSNTISGNTVTKNEAGIWLKSSSNNIISGNNITNNFYYGIWLGDSPNNIISGNIVSSSDTIGIYLEYSSNNVVSGNIVSLIEASGIYLEYSSNNILTGNDVSDSLSGITLGGSSNNILSGNTISSNKWNGILLAKSSNNILVNNTVSNNDWGIRLGGSSNNVIFHNNFIENTFQVASNGSINTWDNGYPSGGNYWSDHVCTGNPSDGSQPYIIDENNIDHYPFQDPDGWLLPPKPVGGKATPINIPISKPESPTLWIWLTTILLPFVVTAVFVKLKKKHGRTRKSTY